MEQSPWEAKQVLSPAVLYHMYKSPPPVPVVSQINLVHAHHPSFWRSNLILSSHLCLGFPSDLFPQSSQPKPCMYLFSPHMCNMPHLSYLCWFDHLMKTWWGVQIMKLLIIQSSSRPCYLVPFSPKHPPPHPILTHHQPMFLLQCERPHFMPMQNNRQNYSSVYFNLCICG